MAGQQSRARKIDFEQAIAGQTGGNNALISLISGASAETKAKNYAQNRDWPYVFIGAIARRIAGLPFCAGNIKRDKKTKRPEVFAKAAPIGLTKSIKQMTAGGRAIEQVESHAALDFLQQPNKLQGKTELLVFTILNLYLSGEFYWMGGPDGDGGAEMWAVPTPWLTPKHEGGLFTSYVLKVPGQAGEGTQIPAELVHRSYFPDPLDYKKAISPIDAQKRAVKIDEYIQRSQQEMFEFGNVPKHAVVVGDKLGPNGEKLGAPVLSGAQRRQIMHVIRTLMTSNNPNDPAILDGLVTDIKRLQAFPSEMDWLQSGETAKKRISQALQVNPYIVGDQLPGSRAQSATAEANYVDNTINPLADMISVALQKFVAPWFDGENEREAGLALWLQEAKPKDEELDLRKAQQGQQSGAISMNEHRAVLGAPIIPEEHANLTGYVATAAGKAAVASLVTQVTTGQIESAAAINMAVNLYGMPQKMADDLLGSITVKPPEPPAGGPFIRGKLTYSEHDQQHHEPHEPLPAIEYKPDKPLTDKQLEKLAGTKLTRTAVKAVNNRQRERLESEAAVGLTPFFERSTRGLLDDLQAEQTLLSTRRKPTAPLPS